MRRPLPAARAWNYLAGRLAAFVLEGALLFAGVAARQALLYAGGLLLDPRRRSVHDWVVGSHVLEHA